MPLFHVWFATRRRKWLLQGETAERARQLMFEIAEGKRIKLVEAQAIVDHCHILVECEDERALSRSMNLLKGSSARRLFQEFPTLKLDARTEHFWQKRFGFRAVPDISRAAVADYIRTQWDRLAAYEKQQ